MTNELLFDAITILTLAYSAACPPSRNHCDAFAATTSLQTPASAVSDIYIRSWPKERSTAHETPSRAAAELLLLLLSVASTAPRCNSRTSRTSGPLSEEHLGSGKQRVAEHAWRTYAEGALAAVGVDSWSRSSAAASLSSCGPLSARQSACRQRSRPTSAPALRIFAVWLNASFCSSV